LQPFPEFFSGLKGRLRSQEPLSKHTSWRVGGAAQWFYEPTDEADLAHLLQQLPPQIPLLWLGLGSNVLIRDGGFRGLVIATKALRSIQWLDERTLWVSAGFSSPQIARLCAHRGLSGSEFLAGIPGTLGGALMMNASAWQQETWALVQKVETINRQGHRQQRPATDYQISYRQIQCPTDEWFIAAQLQLTPAPVASNLARIQSLLQQRQAQQPLGLASAGSVFRNPPGGYAAQLIEAAGWKGRCIGGACVSAKHANFIINHQKATASDIEKLIEEIKLSVAYRYNIELIPEVHLIGDTR